MSLIKKITLETPETTLNYDIGAEATNVSYDSNKNVKEKLDEKMGKGSDYVTAGQLSGSTLGSKATAEGSDVVASFAQAHAEGYQTTASGANSHAEGNRSIASGANTHAEGNTTSATGPVAHTEGSSTVASGTAAHAEGSATKATEAATHAEGSNTLASGYQAHAEGSNTTASNSSAHAEGYGTSAAGVNSHAENSLTIASGPQSHAEGGSSVASGAQSHAEGENSSAIGTTAHAEGKQTCAYGYRSHAEGYLTRAIGVNSHAEGYQTSANGNHSHAEGGYTSAGYNYQHVQGKYNDNKETNAFEIGNGTDGARSNALEVTWDGNLIALGDITDGDGNTLANMIGISQIGMANGVASLDSNGKIPASQLPDTGSDAYRYNIVTKSTGGNDAAITINKYFNEELVSSTDYPYQTFDHKHVIIDSLFDMIYAEDGQAKYTMTLLEDSTDHPTGYSKRWGYDEIVDFSETFIMSDEDISFIAPPFDASKSYIVGDKVTRNGSFYRCKIPHTGAWDIADFDKISVDELFDEVYDSLDDIQIDINQLGISKIGISQIGMANGVAGLNSNAKLDFNDIDVDIVSQADLEDMWDGENLPDLPSGYTMLSYIQNTDAQWINTGVSVTENTSADLIGLIPVEASRYGTFLGEGNQSGRIQSIRYNADSGVIQFQLGDDNKAIDGPTLVNGSEYNVHAEIGKLVVNGTEYTGSGQSLGVPIATLRIFDNGSGERARAKLFRCKIYESGILIRDFIAAKRGTDNAIGMYDVINNTFYGNNGNGDFTAGDPVGTQTSIGDSSTFKNLIDIVKDNLDSKIDISQIGTANGVASLDSTGKVPDSQLPEISGGGIVRAFSAFTFNKGGFYGDNVQTDGTDIYQSNNSSQQVLNQDNLTWSDKTWNGYTSIIGTGVWTDGTNIYYSNNANQYVLDKSTSTQSAKTWTGLTSFQGGYIWTDGTNIYYSNGTQQQVLDKSTSTWSAKTWTGLTNFTGNNIWTDGENIYYSQNTTQYVLDKSTSTWSTKTWSGVTNIIGSRIWKDGTKIHYSNTTTAQAVLDRTLNTWNDENWFGDVTGLDGSKIWSIGTEIFYSNGSISGHLIDYDMAQMLEQNNGIATLGSNGRLKETQTYYVSAGKKSGTTLGSNATAEGSSNIASASNSHAEGYSTQATGSSAHSEGAGTKATGENSHAEGWDTFASHKASHSSGYQTITGREYQFVVGRANEGSSDTLFEVGDGTGTSDRHNVFEVKDKNGQIKIGDTLISTIPTGAHGSGTQQTYQPNTPITTSHADYTGYWVKFNVGSTTMKEGLVPQTFEGITVDATTTTADGTNEDQVKVVVYSNLLTTGGIVVDGEVIDGDGNALSDIATLSGYVADMSDEIDNLENDLDGKANVEQVSKYSNTWNTKTWNELTSFYGEDVWSDETNIYCSNNSNQYVLDKSTSTWTPKTWSGLTSFYGEHIWTDGNNIYYSNGSSYILDKSTSTWSSKIWSNLATLYGTNIWSDGTDIYYSDKYDGQYVLDKSTSTWSAKTWLGITDFDGRYIWSDGTNIYYSDNSDQYILDRSTSTWSIQAWSGLTSFRGNYVWSDGTNIYYSNSSSQYILDKSTSTWSTETWSSLTSFSGDYIWSDGTDIYYSNSYYQYVLDRTEETVIEDSIIVKSNGDVATIGNITDGEGNTLSNVATKMTKGVDYVTAGQKTGTTLGSYATTEGINTAASGYAGHAEGSNTAASASCAHAEGDHSLASHSYSHAEGSYTKTGAANQHVSGTYNIGKSDTLFEIGNGTANDTRANAFEVDTSGNITAAGDITDGAGNNLSNKASKEEVTTYGNTWSNKTQTGLTDFYKSYIWTDGENIYASRDDAQIEYVLNKVTSTQEVKTQYGLTYPGAAHIQTDGTNIYHSNGTDHYILNKTTSTQEEKTWYGLTNFDGRYIQNDGNNIYYSNSTNQYKLNKATDTQESQTQITITYPEKDYIQIDGNNVYYSNGTDHQVLNKATDTQESKTQYGLTNFYAESIQTDGTNIYYSYSTDQYKLNKAIDTQESITQEGVSSLRGNSIQMDGDDIYYSRSTAQYVLSKSNNILIEDSIIVKANGDACDKNGNKFATASDIPVITATTTDPGAGSALTTGNIIFVYDA